MGGITYLWLALCFLDILEHSHLSISNSNMKHFIVNFIRFLLPLGIVFALPAYVLFFGREYLSLDAIVASQVSEPKTLVGFVYNGQSFVPYKQQLVALKKPTIIALGTSRIMQVRSEFFKEGVSFVNAGGGAKNIHDVKQFIENIPKGVSVIILSLDQDMFTNKETSPSYNEQEDGLSPDLRNTMFTNVRKIYIDWVQGKYTLTELFKKRHESGIGIAALVEGDGFRSDGSYRYGHIIKEMNRSERVSREIAVTSNALDTSRYASFKTTGKELDNIRVLEEILALAKEKNIYVVGVLPPYPTPLYETMKANDGYQETITKLPASINGVFKQNGFTLFDFSRVVSYGGNDTEFVDSIHTSDKATLRMLLHMAETDTKVRMYVDTKKAKTMLDLEGGDMFTF
jgi:hypothetical protein